MTHRTDDLPHVATASPAGRLIVNADDWGRDRLTTDRILDCWLAGALSAASGMVFMTDSERSAELAREHELPVGLHLNFTTPFTAAGRAPGISEHQQRIARHLMRHRLAQTIFHPGLVRSFDYLVRSQVEEFHRLYGRAPQRIDGHHHMHLCANVMVQGLLPRGTTVRRSFTFGPREKGMANYMYRSLVDGALARRHRLTEYFFSLPPLEPSTRLERIFALAEHAAVEVETHPVNPEEHRFLTGGALFRWIEGLRLDGQLTMARRAAQGDGG